MRDPDLEIDLLRAFVAVAETGSFTAAADVVKRSQSAVSQKVLRLEEILQRRVFNRNSRSLHLTQDGEQLLVAARHMLQLNDTVLHAMLRPQASGTLRLGISEDFVPRQLPKLLARFGRLYPGIHLDLTIALSPSLVAAFEAGALDAVIAMKDNPAQPGRVLWREQLVWMAAADYHHELTQRTRLVTLPPPGSYRTLMIETLEAARHKWTIACTASNLMSVQAAVAGGLGVTVLGRSFVQAGMQILQPPETWPELPQAEIAVLGEDTAEPGLLQPLISFLTENLAKSDASTLAA